MAQLPLAKIHRGDYEDTGWSASRLALLGLSLAIVEAVYTVAVRLQLPMPPLLRGLGWLAVGLASLRLARGQATSLEGLVAAGLASILHMASMLAYGLVAGFGLNVMAPSRELMLYTMLWVGLTALGREMVRSAAIRGGPFYTVLAAYAWGIASWYPLVSLLLGHNLGLFGSLLEAVNRLGFILAGELVASLLVWLYGWPASSLYVVAAYGLFTWFPLIPAGTAIGRALAFASASSVAAVAMYARASSGKEWWRIAAIYAAAVTAMWIILGSTGVLGFYVFAVGSGSMEPALKPGDLVIVRKASLDSIGVGDIVAYRSPENGVVIVHRVIAIDGGVLVTKGDANPEPDPFKVTGNMVLGKVVARVPLLGYLAKGAFAGHMR